MKCGIASAKRPFFTNCIPFRWEWVNSHRLIQTSPSQKNAPKIGNHCGKSHEFNTSKSTSGVMLSANSGHEMERAMGAFMCLRSPLMPFDGDKYDAAEEGS